LGQPVHQGPRDVIEALARQLDGEVVHDDLGRRCVSREAVRRLFVERAGAERRQREAQERHEAHVAALAELNRPVGGVPIPEGLEDVDAFTVLRQHEIEAKAARKGARQRSTLDEMFTA
jgi:methylphosphotriester-DNA--protein-cysteine methyltransferase